MQEPHGSSIRLWPPKSPKAPLPCPYPVQLLKLRVLRAEMSAQMGDVAGAVTGWIRPPLST